MQISPIRSTQTFGSTVNITPKTENKIIEAVQQGSKKDAIQAISTLEYLRCYYRTKNAENLELATVVGKNGKEIIQVRITSPSGIAYKEEFEPSDLLKNGRKIAHDGTKYIEERLDEQAQHYAHYATWEYDFDYKKSKGLDEKDEALKGVKEILKEIDEYDK